MNQPPNQYDVYHLVQARIGDLYATAAEVHQGSRHEPACEPGFVTRTRWSVGRRLESFGRTVAGTPA